MGLEIIKFLEANEEMEELRRVDEFLKRIAALEWLMGVIQDGAS